MKLTLSKLDVSKRQLETAIGLFFRDGDPVSIHALARAAHEILEALCKKQGVSSILIGGLEVVREDMRDEFRRALNAPRNFFKHADRDANETITFNPGSSEVFLWDACRLYQLLTTERTKDMFIYTMWFSISHPFIIQKPTDKEFLLDAARDYDTGNRGAFYLDVSHSFDVLRSQNRI
jgi:hypothetical protein